jgi:IS30 family transposase
MSYQQLTLEQRYHIWALKKTGSSQTEIAKRWCAQVHHHPELQRNTGQRWLWSPNRPMPWPRAASKPRQNTTHYTRDVGDGGDSPAPGVESRTNLWLVKARPPTGRQP